MLAPLLGALGGAVTNELINKASHELVAWIPILADKKIHVFMRSKPEVLATTDEIIHPERYPSTKNENSWRAICEKEVEVAGRKESTRSA